MQLTNGQQEKIREQFRNEVYKRDQYTCRFCGTKREEKDLDAHHITYRNEMMSCFSR
jgi:5-methylcytosine-specific restriction endonuclease McrA